MRHITFIYRPLSIALLYIIVGIAWIIFSDQLLLALSGNNLDWLQSAQNIKGSFYVLVTGAGLYTLISGLYRQLSAQQRDIDLVMANPNNGMFKIDRQGKPLYISPQLKTLLEYPTEKPLQSFPDPFLKKGEKNLFREFQEVLAANQEPGLYILDLEKRLVSQSGKDLFWAIRGTVEYSRKQGSTLTCYVMDITSLRESELQQLRELEEKKSLMDSIDNSLWSVSRDLQLISFNKHYKEHYRHVSGGEPQPGYHPLPEAMPADLRKKWLAIYNKAIQQEGVRVKESYHGAEGEQFLDIIMNPIYLQGEFIGLSCFARDVTEWKQLVDEKNSALQKLEKNREILETTLNNLPIGIGINETGSGKATFINNKFSEIYGWPKSELVDVESFFEKVYPNPGYRQKIKKQIMEDIQSGDRERMNWSNIEISTNRGERRVVKAKNIPVPSENLMISTVQDTTELRESREKLNTAIDGARLGIWSVDLDTGLMDINEQYAQNLGYSWQDMDHSFYGFEQLVHPDERARIPQLLFQLHQEDHLNWELRLKDAQDEYRWIAFRGRVLRRNQDHKPEELIGIQLDITQRKKRQMELARSEERLTVAQDIGKLGYWEYDPRQQYLIWSHSMFNIYERPEKWGPPTLEEFLAYHPTEERQALEQLLDKARKEHKSYETITRIKVNNKTKDLRAIGKSRVAQGKFSKILGIAQDISDLKETERQLKANLNYVNIMLETASDGIAACDENLKLQFFNQKLRDWVGMESPELDVSEWPENYNLYAYNEDRLLHQNELGLVQTIKAGSLNNYHYRIKRKDGSWIFVEVNGSAIIDEQGQKKGAMIMVRDITERLREQEKINNATLEAVDKERANIATQLHDGLVQSLSMASMNLKNVALELPGAKQNKYYTRSREQLKSAIDQGRDISREIMPRAIFDFGLIDALEEFVKYYNFQKGPKIHFNYNQKFRLKKRLELNIFRIFQEATLNAFNHAGAANIWVSVDKGSGALKGEIVDDGTGFDLAKAETHGGGLMAMRSRASAIDASLKIVPGKEGSKVSLKVKLTNEQIKD